MNKVLSLILFAVAVLALFTGCNKQESGSAASTARKKAAIGSSAPDFTLRDLQEKNISLSDYIGKAVLLVFWKVKCDDCVKSFLSIEALHEMYKGRDFAVIAVNVDNLEYVKPEKIHGFLKDHRLSFKILADEIFYASEAYNIIAVPMAFLIDKNGIITYMKFGKEDWTSRENIERIEKLLK